MMSSTPLALFSSSLALSSPLSSFSPSFSPFSPFLSPFESFESLLSLLSRLSFPLRHPSSARCRLPISSCACSTASIWLPSARVTLVPLGSRAPSSMEETGRLSSTSCCSGEGASGGSAWAGAPRPRAGEDWERSGAGRTKLATMWSCAEGGGPLATMSGG